MNPKYSRYYTFIKPVVNNKAVQEYSFIAFSLVTSIIFAIFAIQPSVKTIISLYKNLEEQKQVLEQVRKKTNDLSLGKTNYDRLNEKAKTNLNSMIPPNPGLPNLVADLYALAYEQQASISGLQIQSTDIPFKSDKLSPEGTIKEVSFALNSQGSYNQLVNFLNLLGNSNHLISIDSVAFTKPTDGLLLMTVNGKIYFLKN